MAFDFRKVSRGELIAGASGIALIVFMLAVHWYGIRSTNLLPSELAPHGVAEGFPRDAFESFTFLDIYLLITAIAAIALPLVHASQLAVPATIPVNLTVAGLGLIAVVLIVLRLIDPPDLATSDRVGNHIVLTDEPGTEVIRKAGPWLGLVAALGIAVGGLTSRRPA
jgi:hypothetical protein